MSSTEMTIATTAAQCLAPLSGRLRKPFDGNRVRGLSALLAFCSVSAGCATFDPQPSYSDKVLLGLRDVVAVPKLSRKLDDYTCGTALLVCEEYGAKLRCRCSAGAVVDFPR
jgi:hypothetical protein